MGLGMRLVALLPLLHCAGSSMEGLVKEGTLSEMLFLVCQDEDLDVRQSAFAVLGDLGKVSCCCCCC